MTTITLANDNRLNALKEWLAHCFNTTQFQIMPIAGDASFRRYFRVHHEAQAWIAMDAPPELEDSHSFVAIQQHLAKLKLRVPQLHHVDLTHGFILMDDLGDTWLWHEALNYKAESLYQNAIDELLVMQLHAAPSDLSIFDTEFMSRELSFFKHWFLQEYLGLSLSESEQQLLQRTFSQLIDSAMAQPYYFTHRDYHSRNLMVLASEKIGLLDFQDAVLGPISYDLVSLLRDCYVTLDEQQFQRHLEYYFQKARVMGLLPTQDFNTFEKWFDWMGLQRHLKAIFIFARKQLRDNNPNFLGYIPRTLNYAVVISNRYAELAEFHTFLQQRVLPIFEQVYAS